MLIGLIWIHWFADFFCQTDKMAINKSKSIYWLTIHVFVYFGHCPLCVLKCLSNENISDQEEMELRFKSEGMINSQELGWHFPRKVE
jgi:hypothetical protein